MLNKEEQYAALYFPEHMVQEKKKTYWALLDIDCNFSKLICALLPSIRAVAEMIKAKDLNFLHYEFKLIAKRKKVTHDKEKEKDKSKKL